MNYVVTAKIIPKNKKELNSFVVVETKNLGLVKEIATDKLNEQFNDSIIKIEHIYDKIELEELYKEQETPKWLKPVYSLI